MKVKYRGEIEYNIDKKHPDIKCIEEWERGGRFRYSDEYSFQPGYTEGEMIGYIKQDLKLVAGGGYNADHIHNVTFNIYRI